MNSSTFGDWDSLLTFDVLKDSNESFLPEANSRKRACGPDHEPLELVLECSDEKKAKQLNQYERCCELLILTYFDDDTLDGFFLNLFDVECVEEIEIGMLEKTFSEKEIIEINSILDWFHLLTTGYLPESSDYESNAAEVKKFLGIRNCIEILNPTIAEYESCENCVSFTRLIEIILCSCNHNLINESSHSCFLKLIGKVFFNQISGEMILLNIKSVFNMRDYKSFALFKESFDQVDENVRLRWALFVSIASYHLSDHDQINGLTTQSVDCFLNTPSELLPLLYKINKHLKKMLTSRSLRCHDELFLFP